MYLNLLKITIPTAVTFFVALLITPLATHFFYKYKMWKKYARSNSTKAGEFQKIHDDKAEQSTPRTGGMIIWFSVIIVTLIFYYFSLWLPTDASVKLNFLSRNQTLIPFFTLLFASLIGLWDDLIQIYGKGKFAQDDKAWRIWKALLIATMALGIGLWFYFKLGMFSIHIPFNGELFLDFLIIPFFVLVALATFSGGVIDGVDGLSGGVLASIFGAYSVIAYSHNQVDIAAFSGAITGATLAFLWFNIPPARFYMGETGMMGLTITLATIAFLTDTVLLLPVIAFPLVITTASVIIQLFSKKFRGKKFFKLAPLHHHFEAGGWSREKVTMRYWILSIIFAIVGVILAIVS